MRVQTPLLWLLAAAALAPPAALGQAIGPGGPTHAGTRAVCDLPAGQHMRNTVGSDGLGLCVPTSCEIAGRWQSTVLAGLQAWCQQRPGGSDPDKLEQYIVQFCRERRREIPPYVQHTGGDEAILDLAVRTGRMPCITYAGQDDFYRGQTIAHMVCLAHLDGERAAIIDNNRPGQWVWMTRKQLLDRWRGVDANGRPLTVPTLRGPMQVGGGWAVVFLDSPPPPYTAAPPTADRPDAERVQYGQCPGGVCPPVRPFQPVSLPAAESKQSTPDEYNRAVAEVLAGTRIVLVVGRPPSWFRETGVPVHRSPSFPKLADGVYECWPLEEAGKVVPKMKPVASAEGLSAAAKVEAPPKAESNFGVDLEKLNKSAAKWFCNGAECNKDHVFALLAGNGLVDDSERWFLVHVGTPSEAAAFLAAAKALPAELAGKVHVKSYAAADWPVAQFGLPPGVSIRKPAKGRVGEEAGRLAGEVTADTLRRFVGDSLNPPPKPMPPPPPAPQPDQPPAPEPAPTPSAPLGIPLWLLALAGFAALVFCFRRKQS